MALESVRELFASLGLDVDEGGFNAAEAAIGGIAGGMAKLGAVFVGMGVALAGMVGSMAHAAGRIDDLKQRSGESAESLQELTFVGKQNGLEMEDIAQALQFAQKNAVGASKGAKELSAAFRAVKVDVHDASGKIKPASQLLLEVATGMGGLKDDATRTAVALQIFGKSGARLLPMMRLGGAGIKEQMQLARDLGFVMSKDTVAAGDALGDSIDILGMAFQGLRNIIAGPLLVPVNKFIRSLIRWIAANKTLIGQRVSQAMVPVIFAAKALWKILTVVGKTVGWMIDNWKLFAAIGLSVLIPMLLAKIAAIATLIGWYVLLGAAMLASGTAGFIAGVMANLPWIALGLLIFGLILILEDLWTAWNGGESLLADWTAFLDDFLKADGDDPWWLATIKQFFRLIFDMQGEVPKLIEDIKKAFADLFQWFKDSPLETISGLLSSFTPAGMLQTGIEAGMEIFGGGASPAASAMASPAGVGAGASSTTTTVNMGGQVINAAPGQSAGEVGDASGNRAANALKRELSRAKKGT